MTDIVKDDTRFYVYLYLDPERNAEPIYVGKGCGRRYKHHLTRTDKHPLTHRLRKMLSNNVEPIIEVFDGFTEEEALVIESQIIAEIGRKNLGSGSLLNLTDGGERNGNKIVSEETRQKQSAAHMGQTSWNKGKSGSYTHSEEAKLAKSQRMLGREVSVETGQKISASKKGYKHTEEAIEKMKQSHQNMSPETIEKMRKAKSNISEETRQKMSIAAKNRRKKQLGDI